MTLRVTISIVPFGNEDMEYDLDEINISNVGPSSGGLTTYGVEVNKYKTGKSDFFVQHKRRDGSTELVRKVLERLSQNGK